MLNVLYDDENVLIAQTLGFDGNHYKQGYGYNLALHVADDGGAVLKRRAHLLRLLNDYSTVHQIVWLNQVHGASVLDFVYCQSLSNADAVISRQKQTALAIMTADCVPIALFDDDGQIACIHAGWQGLAAGVIAQTVQKMRNAQAYIGVAISQANYEIPRKLADKIMADCVSQGLVANDAHDMFDWLCQASNSPDKVWFDVPMLARLQLRKCGVHILNGDVADSVCSYADERFYSHRRATHRQQKATGRMAMIIIQK